MWDVVDRDLRSGWQGFAYLPPLAPNREAWAVRLVGSSVLGDRS
jgi:hypothetical protein